MFETRKRWRVPYLLYLLAAIMVAEIAFNGKCTAYIPSRSLVEGSRIEAHNIRIAAHWLSPTPEGKSSRGHAAWQPLLRASTQRGLSTVCGWHWCLPDITVKLWLCTQATRHGL